MKKYLVPIVFILFSSLNTACDSDWEEKQILEPVKIELTDTERMIVEDQNVFSFDLLASFYQEKQGTKNVLLSPFSVHCILGMLSNGATGETKNGILEAMRLDGYGQEELNGYFNTMIEGLQKTDPSVRMKTANSIWHDESIRLKDNFIHANQDAYDAQISAVDFGSSEAFVRINDWCKDVTDGKIEKIIDQKEVDARLLAVLLNAVYFKAKWENEFDKSKTTDDVFTLEDGRKATVPFMHKKQIAHYAENSLFSTMFLSYSCGSYYMRLILPKEGVALAEVVEALREPWRLYECLQESQLYEVNLSLPRFDVKSDFELNEVLSALGMKQAFDIHNAGFENMSETPLAVSKVKHSVCMKVDEEGSEGAAVTSAEMIETSAGPAYGKVDFNADHPFLFLIAERMTNAVLFLGTVEDF